RFLGEDRRRIASALDQKWQSRNGTRWRQQHDELRSARERLARLQAIESPTPEQLFEQAALQAREGHDDRALDLYKSANAAGHVPAGLAAGRMLLDRGDNVGLAMIEA